MKVKNIVNLILFSAGILLIFSSTGYSQLRTQKGIKFGMELSSYLTEDGRGFTKKPGNTMGLYINPSIWSYGDQTALRLRLELNCVRIYYYTSELTSDLDKDFTVNKEYCAGGAEFGAIPEYYHQIDEDNAYGIYLGLSIGIGADRVTRKYDTGYSYREGWNMVPIGAINLGVTYYYKFLLFDLDYKYPQGGMAQIGFIL